MLLLLFQPPEDRAAMDASLTARYTTLRTPVLTRKQMKLCLCTAARCTLSATLQVPELSEIEK